MTDMIALTADRGTTSESFGLAPRAVCNTKAPRQRIDRCDARVQDRVSQEGAVATRYSVRSALFRPITNLREQRLPIEICKGRL